VNNDKMIQFVKRWREIERLQKNIDFDRGQLARGIRAEFEKGARGDEQFRNWCVVEIGMTAYGARELLLMAVAASVVPDESHGRNWAAFVQSDHWRTSRRKIRCRSFRWRGSKHVRPSM
jgi:hypothetical protein